MRSRPRVAPVSITVTEGLTPTIAWTPLCGVRELLISEVVTDSPALAPSLWRWSVSATARLIEPPLRYGRQPPGTLAGSAQPLAVGRTYMVSLSDHPIVDVVGPGVQSSRIFAP